MLLQPPTLCQSTGTCGSCWSAPPTRHADPSSSVTALFHAPAEEGRSATSSSNSCNSTVGPGPSTWIRTKTFPLSKISGRPVSVQWTYWCNGSSIFLLPCSALTAADAQFSEIIPPLQFKLSSVLFYLLIKRLVLQQHSKNNYFLQHYKYLVIKKANKAEEKGVPLFIRTTREVLSYRQQWVPSA